MAQLVLETPEGVALRSELAGPGTRLLAAAIDGLLFGLGVGGATLLFLVLGLEFASTLLLAGGVLLLVGYWFVSSMLLDGRTPGKLWTGIRVCDAQGFAPGAGQLFLRALFVPLEAVLVLPVPLVWILIATTPRRQRLGDLVAGTLVLRDRARAAPPEPAAKLSWSTLEPRAFDLDPTAVRALDGRDLGVLRDFLTRKELEPEARARLEHRLARHYAARLGKPATFTGAEALAFLRELFLLLREVRGAARPLSSPPAAAAAAPDSPPGGGSPPR